MTRMTRHEPGTFCWVELATPDPKDARRFYGGLFGWSVREIPMGEGPPYAIFEKDGDEVAACYLQDPAQARQGVPPNWMSYVTVASADETAKKAMQHGGNVLMEPFDVMDFGRMTMVQDPTGATFGLWQPKSQIGAKRWNEPNVPCWNELLTNDLAKAGDFYENLFGWKRKVGGDYTEFLLGDSSFAGMMEIHKEWGPVPPHWGAYVRVDDTDAAAKRAGELGGKVCMPPADIENVGRFAGLADPQGAGFSVIKLFGAD